MQGFSSNTIPAIGATFGPVVKPHAPWTGRDAFCADDPRDADRASAGSFQDQLHRRPPAEVECRVRSLSTLPGRAVCARHPVSSHGPALQEAMAYAGQSLDVRVSRDLDVSGLCRERIDDPP
jgi:hypothetical protein